MNENVFDVFGIPTWEIPDNAVLQRDWCDWKFIELPVSTLTCPDIVACVQPDLDNLRAAVNGKLECADLAACQTIIDIVTDVAALPATILGSVELYLQTNNDAVNTLIPNAWTIEFTWVNGISAEQLSAGVVTIWLPSGNDWDVLIRNTWTASRTPFSTQLDSMLSASVIIQTLQAQIVGLQAQIAAYHP